jgi:CelD/BcsL family acetyltransferase involved in cellulose biosynthesis
LKHGTPQNSWHYEIYQNFQDAEQDWRKLQETAFYSAYQHYEWQECWMRHIGKNEGFTPLIIVAYCENKPTFLLPLGLYKYSSRKIASFLGGKHNNYNMGLFDPEYSEQITCKILKQAFQKANEVCGPIDYFELLNQPESWQGHRNPLACLSHQPSPSFSFKLNLTDDFEKLAKGKRTSESLRKLRKKQQKLDLQKDLKIKKAETTEDIDRALDAFFSQKRERFIEMGVESIFDEPEANAFFREMAHKNSGQNSDFLVFHWLEAAGKIRALYAGGVSNKRYSCCVNSISIDDMTRNSPADVLLYNLIKCFCEQGYQTLDLGIGEAQYKESWCEPDPLFDTFYAITVSGHIVTKAVRLKTSIKRTIKQTPFLWSLVIKARRIKARFQK